MPVSPEMYQSVRSTPSFDDDSSTMSLANTTWIPQQMLSPYQQSPSTDAGTASSQSVKPLLKRRRVTRACDECRRKKIKCDGKHPCTHCTVYSYDCTYDQPSNRRRNPGPQYIEGLEKDKQQLATLIRLIRPDIDPFDPKFDADKLISELQDSGRAGGSMTNSPHEGDSESDDSESRLESMVEAAGRLEIDERGAMDFHGHSSSVAFLAHLRCNFQRVLGSDFTTAIKSTAFPESKISPGPSSMTLPETSLPSREVANVLVESCFDDACALMRFIHRPSFDKMVDRIYNIPQADWTQHDKDFLPLLYLALAVGCLFAGDEANLGIAHAITEGTKYFLAGRCMIEITDCRDIFSIQTVILMVIFLQSSTKMSTCYSYVWIALSAAVRMGLHRSLELNLNPIERETRKRIFWTVRKMDTYVSALLGLPKGIGDDDIDQEMPLDVDDEYITETEIKEQPEGSHSTMVLSNAHTRLLKIMAKVVKAVYPLKHGSVGGNMSYTVSFASIREIENELQKWLEGLPNIASQDMSPQYKKCRYLLEMAFCHVKMMVYRPFIHYIRPTMHSNNASIAARNCIHTAIRIVNLAEAMREQNIMNGAYWFTMYTTFFATISLLFFVLERPNGSFQCWKAAKTGRNALECLKVRSFAADRCSVALKQIFDSIPQHLIDAVEKEGEEAEESKGSCSGSSAETPLQAQAPTEIAKPWPPKNQLPQELGSQEQQSELIEASDVGTHPPSSTYSPSDLPSSVATPDTQMQFQNIGIPDINAMIMYGAQNFYVPGGMSIDPAAAASSTPQQLPKTELHSAMDTDSTAQVFPIPPRDMMYDVESQTRNPWGPYSIPGQQHIPTTTGPAAVAGFGNVDINPANSNLMLLQGQTYGAMPGGGSAMGLEDFFGDEWSEHMLQHQMFRP